MRLLYLFLFLLVVPFVSADYVLQYTEDFEDQDFTGWTGDAEAVLSIESVVHINGSYSLQSDNGANGGAQVFFSPNMSSFGDRVRVEFQYKNLETGNSLSTVSEVGGSFKRWIDQSDSIFGGNFECFDLDSGVDGDDTDAHSFRLDIDWNTDLLNCTIDGSVTNTQVDISSAQNKGDDWRFLNGHGSSPHNIVIDDFKLWAFIEVVPVPFVTVKVVDLYDNVPLSGLTVFVGSASNVTDGSGLAIVYNPTGLNFTVDGGADYFNVSGTGVENGTFNTSVFGAFYNLTAFDVFDDVVSLFNVSTDEQTNVSVAGFAQLLLKPSSTLEVTFSKAGWFDVLINVTTGGKDFGVANVTTMHDNEFTISAVDALDNSSVNSFFVNSTNTSESFFSVLNTSSGSLVVPLLQGFLYNFFIDAVGFAFANTTLEANASSQSHEFSLFPQNSVFLFFLDEVTLVSITENVSVEGIKGNLSFVNYSTAGELFLSDLDPGVWTFTVDAPSYDERQLFVTVTARSTQDLDVFLLNSSLSETTTFTVKNADTADVIPGAVMTMQQKVGVNWVTIDQQTTGAFGIAVFRLLIEGTYRFTIEAPGFITKVSQVFIQTQNSYIISMKADNAQNFNSYFGDFTYVVAPSAVEPDNTTFSITTSSAAGVLDWFAVTVTLNGSSTTSNVTASPSGGTASVVLNLSGFGGHTVTAVYRVQSQNFDDPLELSRNWLIYELESGNYTLSDFLVYYADDDNGLGFASRGILLTVVAVLVALALGTFFGVEAGAIGAVLVYLVGSYFGWLHWSITLVVVSTLIGLLLLRGGRP